MRVRDKRGQKRRDSNADIVSGDNDRDRMMHFRKKRDLGYCQIVRCPSDFGTS